MTCNCGDLDKCKECFIRDEREMEHQNDMAFQNRLENDELTDEEVQSIKEDEQLC